VCAVRHGSVKFLLPRSSDRLAVFWLRLLHDLLASAC
jgi:hypothetical protein